jgi:hypothetical protein
VVILGLANAAPALLRTIPRPLLPGALRADQRLEREIDMYRPLASRIGDDDVVMADLNVSRHVPAFAGKVVAFIDPEAFVPDEQRRREETSRFFAEIAPVERQDIIRRYGVKFAAIDRRSPVGASLGRWLDTQATVFDDGRLQIVRVLPETSRAGTAAGQGLAASNRPRH